MTNVSHIFMDSLIVKPVNVMMRDQRTKDVTRKASAIAMTMWIVDGDKCSSCSEGYYKFPQCLGKRKVKLKTK